MRLRLLLSAGLSLLTAAVISLGAVAPANAAVPSVHDETGLLTTTEVAQLQQVLTKQDRRYEVHLSVTLLKRLPEGKSLRQAAEDAAQAQGLSASERTSQIALLYVRHGGEAYTVLGEEAVKRIPRSQAEDIWRNQIHGRFHTHHYFEGLAKGMTLLGASYEGYTKAAYTQPLPPKAECDVLNERGWFGVRLAFGLTALIIVVSLLLTFLPRLRRARRQRKADG